MKKWKKQAKLGEIRRQKILSRCVQTDKSSKLIVYFIQLTHVFVCLCIEWDAVYVSSANVLFDVSDESLCILNVILDIYETEQLNSAAQNLHLIIYIIYFHGNNIRWLTEIECKCLYVVYSHLVFVCSWSHLRFIPVNGHSIKPHWLLSVFALVFSPVIFRFNSIIDVYCWMWSVCNLVQCVFFFLLSTTTNIIWCVKYQII